MAGDLDKKKADEALLRELKEVREFIRAKMEENAKRELQESQIGALERRARREKKTAHADEKWDELAKAADALIAEGQNGFDNWVSAMSRIVGLCKKLGTAMAASDPMGKLFLEGHQRVAQLLDSVKYQKQLNAAQAYNETDKDALYARAKELGVDLRKAARNAAAMEEDESPAPSPIRS
ncbi:hypothetical protein [Legionella oakridgensis]|uniref:Uncharacterized protein n=1 Tax=Legionella oakridgensis TaxID=29423 RepID=A0A0W0XIS3_9GAMM|nr:hypothetical protein [Legionella oakridgensis]ETO93280.1 hypothetical protein LOR_71c20240 [Legionella oakridgensis RV-2-2007]KTD44440.1 hypothetical protein Loak_0140 [Legionella oakridgensis]STY20191.1 Uncharacterised protein [Legionella longbeachae]